MKKAVKKEKCAYLLQTRIYEMMSEDHVWLENPWWKAYMFRDAGPAVTIQLGLLVEIVDARDFEGQDTNYPYIVESRLFPTLDMLDPGYLTDVAISAGIAEEEVEITDVDVFDGGVPAEFFLNSQESDDSEIEVEYQAVSTRTGKYYRFKRFEDARWYVDNILPGKAEAAFATIGFMLDRPINLVGHTGWSVLREQCFGVPRK